MTLFGKFAAVGSTRFSHGVSVAPKAINTWFILMVTLFTVICAIRFNVGTDYPRYLSAYVTGRVAKAEKFELLFKGISTFLHNHRIHPSIYFGVWAFIQIFFFLLAFKKEKYLYPYLMFFLFTNGLFLSWMNGIRQDLATCIWLFSLTYITNKKIIPYVICCIIAFMFHRSAIILIIFYPLFVKGTYFNKIPVQLAFIALAFILRYTFDSYIMSLNSIINFYTQVTGYNDFEIENLYNQMAVDRGGSGVVLFIRAIIYLIIIFYSKKMKLFFNSRHFNLIYMFFIIGFFTKYAIPVGAITIARPFRYFSFFLTIILAYFIYFLYNEKKLKNGKVFGFCIILLYLSIFIISQFKASIESFTIFQFFFDQPQFPTL